MQLEDQGAKRLDGCVAAVTGAATGIGRATAEIYAREGAKVVVADIRVEPAEEVCAAIEADGGEAIFVQTDVSKARDLEQLVATAEQHFGKLDIMTANAGIMGRNPWLPLHEREQRDVEDVFAVNFYGTLNAFKFAIPALLRAGGGAMTATTSLSAHRGIKGLDAYTASKAAVAGIIRSLTAQYSPTIRFNAVSPGRIATEIAAHTAESNQGIEWPDSPRIPVGEPADIASAHLFLASREARFVAGQILCVDGGRSALDIV